MTAPAIAAGSAIRDGAFGVWEWDVKNDRFSGDARFAELCGFDAEETAAGMPRARFLTSIDPRDVMRVRLALAGAVNGVEVFSRDFRVARSDGVQTWVTLHGRAHPDLADKIVRISGVLADVTEQKRLQEKLRIAQSAGGVGTFEYVSGFATAEVSEEFCRLLGLQLAQTLPVRTINSVVQGGMPALLGAPEDQIPGSTFRELLIRRADTGEERWLARSGENLQDGPRGARFVGVIYDITPAKRSEQRLVELSQALAQRVEIRTQERDRLWNLTRDLVAVLAPDRTVRAINPAWQTLLGYRESEVVAASFDAFVLGEDLPGLTDKLRSPEANQALPDFDCRMVAKNGTVKWIDWNVVFSDDLFYATGRDSTLRRQLEEQLRQSQKMEALGQLTGGLAHDFNNMLTGVIGGIEIVKRRIAEGRAEGVERFADAAMTSARRAAALTQRLLAFARRQSLDSQVVRVNELIGSMEDLLRRTLGEQVTLKTDLDEAIWPVLADANQLESALLNLAINARDAMDNGGILTIATRNVAGSRNHGRRVEDVGAGDHVEISVQDTGSGMPPDVQARAFDPFYTTKPLGQGTGLGLSMVYGFVQQSRGYVGIQSEVGRGTKVVIHLPRTAEQSEGQTAVARPEPGAGETVLVVEDDPSVRDLVLEVLQELGYEAIEATDAQTALERLRLVKRLDLMITDVGLPGLNGRQLADIARQTRASLPILFMTGYAPGATVRKEFLAPGMDMVLKPFTMDALSVKVREMLPRRATS